jgi:restriction system protein
MNRELADRLDELDSLLTSALRYVSGLTFDSLKQPLEIPSFEAEGLDRPLLPPRRENYMPERPGFLARAFGGMKSYRRALEAAERAYTAAVAEHQAAEWRREQHLKRHRSDYERHCEDIRRNNARQHELIDQFAVECSDGDVEAVSRFFTLALDRDDLPDGFPLEHRVAFVSDSRQLVIERDLPGVDVVPAVAKYRYVKTKDRIEDSARPAGQIKAQYAALVANFALRTLHILVKSVQSKTPVESIVLNCFVDSIDPATGHKIRPCLLTVRVEVAAFRAIDLAKVDPVACLKALSAQVSASPHELRAVRPIVNFNMVDPRFIESTDVLATLDSRPNLAELTPGEFEALITNLFTKMGLETKLTQASRDGGVDCVAWDMRPIVGGKVIVQAKRYKRTVGVSAVRDLYGTVMNEGAAKGILVATSGYGKSAFQFANNKPLELVDGAGLLYLLEEHAGVRAKIEFPEDWVDPSADAG